MSLKIKLISCISLFMLMIGVLIIGVYAATQQQITMQGSVSFNVPDKSLYVKSVRYQEAGGEVIDVESFVPGYINGSYNMDLTSLNTMENSHGTFSLYFDMINLEDNPWVITNVTLPDTLTSQGVSASYSGVIATNELTDTDDDGYKNFDLSTPIDGSLVLTITAPNSSTINLEGIVITINEPSITVSSSDANLGTAAVSGYALVGEEVTLQADFTGSADADFLGWRAGSVDGELVSTLSDYTFTYTEESPTTYYAIFEEPNEYLNYTYNTPAAGEAQLRSSNAGAIDIIVPSEIYRTSQSSSYVVTSLYSAPSSSSGVFYQARSTLQSVSLPETITSIGDYAFGSCSGLTSITLPSRLTSIGSSAFQYCSGLTGELVIPEGVTSIGSNAFESCRGLTSIDLSGCTSLTSIGNFAFYQCSGLTGELVIPEGVTSIGGQTFYSCRGLTSVTLPSSLTSIGNNAFHSCSGLTSIDLSGCTRLTSIGDHAFYSCSGLTSITIPESVTSIGGSAFRDCSSLTSITINATTPPTLGTNAIPSNETNIYVPAASVETYQSASGWSSFASKISAIV